MPVAKKTDSSNESTNKSRQQDVNDTQSGTDDSIERTKQMKATIERRELILHIIHKNSMIIHIHS